MGGAGWGVLAIGVVVTAASAAPARGQLRGDAEATASVERMLEAIGGREAWSSGRTLELTYRGWWPDRPGEVLERAWRDLADANQRIEIEADTVDVVYVLTADQGWTSRNDSTRILGEDTLREHRAFWPRDFYTLLRRLARSDPDLWVSSAGEQRIAVYSERQGEIGWFEIASGGGIVRWGTVDRGEPLEYVYGPMRDFGPLRFPAWGASLDGSWRFEYERVALSGGPIPSELLAARE